MALDMNWIKEQLAAARVRKPVGNATMKMIEFFNSMELEEEHREKAVEMFSLLAKGHSYVKEDKKEVWTPVRPGNIKVTDQVRVKFDAYDGELGAFHNGRRGVVVGVRYGDIIIKTTDGKEPQLDGAHYSPYSLEKLVS
jgi:hypothetical protein